MTARKDTKAVSVPMDITDVAMSIGHMAMNREVSIPPALLPVISLPR